VHLLHNIRNLTSNPTKIIIIDTTQAAEVMFALFFELLFIDSRLPTYTQFFGLLLLLFGLLGITFRWEKIFEKKRDNNIIDTKEE
jgi:protein-S-isoprenylcysteine O-methyltransferase Ste14